MEPSNQAYSPAPQISTNSPTNNTAWVCRFIILLLGCRKIDPYSFHLAKGYFQNRLITALCGLHYDTEILLLSHNTTIIIIIMMGFHSREED